MLNQNHAYNGTLKLETISRVLNVTKPRKYIYTGKELLLLPNDDRDFLWDPFLLRSGLTALVGVPDAGKSQFARMMTLSIVGDKETFLGMPLTPRHRHVIYVSTEDDEINIKHRLRTQGQAMGLNSDDAERIRFVFYDDMTLDELIDVLRELLTKQPVDLLVLDSYGDIHTGDQSSNSDMRSVLKRFSSIAREFECTILILHHLTKAGYSLAPSQQHVSGGAAFAQKARAVFDLRCGEGSVKYLTCVKGNYISRTHKDSAMVLEFDEETFLFSDSGERIAIADLAKDSGPEKPKVEIRWNKLFTEAFSEFSAQEVESWMFREYGFRKTQANKYMSEALNKVLEKRREGNSVLYSLREQLSTLW